MISNIGNALSNKKCMKDRNKKKYLQDMKNTRDWKKYNKKLVKRGMILLDPVLCLIINDHLNKSKKIHQFQK